MNEGNEHIPEFLTSSARGAVMACSCGWEFRLPDVVTSPFPTSGTMSFFTAGFNAGRVYEKHLRPEEPA